MELRHGNTRSETDVGNIVDEGDGYDHISILSNIKQSVERIMSSVFKLTKIGFSYRTFAICNEG